MFNGIGWLQYVRLISALILAYYLLIVLVYRKSLVQWWKERKKTE
ncbi:MAG: hypothetical protein V4450_17785 [Bacteroidota bacterium]